jgi:hypothetical protein
MRGCLATRIIFASGAPLEAAMADKPTDMAWVFNFKFGNPYEILNGWKRWDSSDSNEYAEGGDGFSFPLFIECPGYECITSISAATTLVASTLAAVSVFAF